MSSPVPLSRRSRAAPLSLRVWTPLADSRERAQKLEEQGEEHSPFCRADGDDVDLNRAKVDASQDLKLVALGVHAQPVHMAQVPGRQDLRPGDARLVQERDVADGAFLPQERLVRSRDAAPRRAPGLAAAPGYGRR